MLQVRCFIEMLLSCLPCPHPSLKPPPPSATLCRQRKFKIDDLINHTHNEKHDLASEIKRYEV